MANNQTAKVPQNQNAKAPPPPAPPPAAPRRVEAPPEPMPVAREGLGATGQILIAGGVVVGGVLLLTALQRAQAVPGAARPSLLDTLLGRRPAPTPTVPRALTPAPVPQVPVPTQPGITFRSGGLGGFIPIPFDQIAGALASGIAGIFQPSRAEAAELTMPGGVEAPATEQWVTFREQASPESVELLQADGSYYVPADQFDAGAQWYDEGAVWEGSFAEAFPLESGFETVEPVALGPGAFEEVGFPTVAEEFSEFGGFF